MHKKAMSRLCRSAKLFILQDPKHSMERLGVFRCEGTLGTCQFSDYRYRTHIRARSFMRFSMGQVSRGGCDLDHSNVPAAGWRYRSGALLNPTSAHQPTSSALGLDAVALSALA